MSNNARAAKLSECDVLAHNAPWQEAQRSHEVNRLKTILRSPQATPSDKTIARDMLKHWSNVGALAIHE